MRGKVTWIAAGLLLVAAIIVALYMLVGAPAQDQPAALIEAINQVEAHARSRDQWQPAVVGMDIYGGGQVRTGTHSSARIELLEGIVRLSAESLFTVRECTTRQGRSLTTLFLEEGRLWAHLVPGQPHEFRVETASAVAAVRDTRLSVWVALDQTMLVSVAEGEAELAAQGESVRVSTGQQATVKAGQPPEPPEPMSDEERALWATEGEMPELAPPTPVPTPTATYTPQPTLAPTNTPDVCAGATDPGARQRLTLEQIVPCLNTVSKVSEFMLNNMQRDDGWDAKVCGEICYSPAWLVYQNGVDDLHGLVTLECYLLEKNGWDAYHIGLSVESPIGANVCGVNTNGTVLILNADGKTAGSFNSLAEVARHYIRHGWMKDGGQLRTIKASQITQVTTNSTTPSLLDLPWVLHPY